MLSTGVLSHVAAIVCWKLDIDGRHACDNPRSTAFCRRCLSKPVYSGAEKNDVLRWGTCEPERNTPAVAGDVLKNSAPNRVLRLGVLGAARIVPVSIIGPAKKLSDELRVVAVASREEAKARTFSGNTMPSLYRTKELLDDTEDQRSTSAP